MRSTSSTGILVSAVFFAAIAVSCGHPETEAPSSRSLRTTQFGSVGGKAVSEFVLTNAAGAEVRIIEYGGIVVGIKVPDRDGNLGDVVLGFDDLESYVQNNPYFGAITGRYANRIDAGRFEIDGTKYQLPVNNGPNSLHGGNRGFDKVIWSGRPLPSGDGIELAYTSRDGEEGYPGTLATKVTYTWSDSNELRIGYEARTDKPTVVNLTNHSYFNLRDGGASTILEHEMTILANRYTPVDETLIPTGEIAPLDGTPLDFRTATAIGARIDAEHEQLGFGSGYDHNYVLDRQAEGLAVAATVHDPITGRTMDVLTEEPGVQFYSGNFLDGQLTGKGGVNYQHRSGFCLETQHFPDSPNQPEFPSTVLRPGEVYSTATVYRFSVR